MIRTQIQITKEQSNKLKRLASRQGVSVAELIRNSIDKMISASSLPDQDAMRRKAIEAAGKLTGPNNLSVDHDIFLGEAYKS
jgi:hypothetical protein